MRRNNHIGQIYPSSFIWRCCTTVWTVRWQYHLVHSIWQNPLSIMPDLVQQQQIEFSQCYPQFAVQSVIVFLQISEHFHWQVCEKMDISTPLASLIWYFMIVLNKMYKRYANQMMLIVIYHMVTSQRSSLSHSSCVWITICTSVIKSSTPLSNIVSL